MSDFDKCRICGQSLTPYPTGYRSDAEGTVDADCPLCGKYKLVGTRTRFESLKWPPEIKRVWLLWNDAPGGVEAPLILFDVEFPIAIEVSGKIDGSELDQGLCHLLSPPHS